MKILLATDKFKGSFDAQEVAALLSQGIRRSAPKATIVTKPAFDGGEGTADAIASLISMSTRTVQTENIAGQNVNASIHWLGERRLALIESSQVLRSEVPWTRQDFLRSSSWALGKLISHALELRPVELWITSGGTLTSDGGWGAASYFGLDALGEDGSPFEPAVLHLGDIRRATLRHEHAVLKKTRLHLLCDVNAPFLSPGGTSLRSFLKQKGARDDDEEMVIAGLGQFLGALRSDGFETLAPDAPHTGAAGGLALGLGAVAPELSCSSGAEVFFRMSAMRAAVADADWVVCGEGFLDESTLYGKSAFAIARLAGDLHKPLTGVFGGLANERLPEALGLRTLHTLDTKASPIKGEAHAPTLNERTRSQWLKACRSKLIEIGQAIGREAQQNRPSEPSAS